MGRRSRSRARLRAISAARLRGLQRAWAPLALLTEVSSAVFEMKPWSTSALLLASVRSAISSCAWAAAWSARPGAGASGIRCRPRRPMRWPALTRSPSRTVSCATSAATRAFTKALSTAFNPPLTASAAASSAFAATATSPGARFDHAARGAECHRRRRRRGGALHDHAGPARRVSSQPPPPAATQRVRPSSAAPGRGSRPRAADQVLAMQRASGGRSRAFWIGRAPSEWRWGHQDHRGHQWCATLATCTGRAGTRRGRCRAARRPNRRSAGTMTSSARTGQAREVAHLGITSCGGRRRACRHARAHLIMSCTQQLGHRAFVGERAISCLRRSRAERSAAPPP